MPSPGQTIKPLIRLGKTPDDCWEYLGPKTEAGYGKKTHLGRQVMATTWLWETMFGPLPDGLIVSTAMTCGNAGCMNPHHWRAVPFTEARRSSIQTTLTPGDVREIKAAKKTKTGQTARLLALRYGVSEATIYDIWRGTTWSPRRPMKRAA